MKESVFIGELEIDPKKSDVLSEEDKIKIEASKERWGVIENAEQRFESTIEATNYRAISTLPNEMEYPSVDEWITARALQGMHIRLYPTFVEDRVTKDIHFAKANVMKKQDFGGLKAEAEILSQLPSTIAAPKLIEYIPEKPELNQLELLVIEAVKWSEAHVMPLQEWKAEHVEDAIRQIKEIGEIPMENVPNLSPIPSVSIEETFERAESQLDPEFKEEVETILHNFESHSAPVLVHGDTWTKNILVGTDPEHPKTMIVDWERAGAGYKGQDLARTWWELWNNEEVQHIVPESYFNKVSDEEKQNRKAHLEFGVIFEALRWIADRNDKLKSPTIEETKREIVLNEIKDIQTKAQKMLKYIRAAADI